MKTIVVDANGLAHKVRHSYKGLSFDGANTNVLYGFVKQILKLSHKFQTNKFVFCWDSKTSKREEIYPNYKKKRKAKKIDRTVEETQQDFYDFEQIGLLQESFLQQLGFTWSFVREGYEGDDLIASVVMCNDGDFVINSEDHDMLQLLNYADIYYKKGKKEHYLTQESFKKDYGIDPADWVQVLATAGCKTDEVEGITGIAEKSALKWLRGEATERIRTKVLMNPDIIDRNTELVKLPFNGMESVIINGKQEFSATNIISLAEQYGMYSLTGKKFSEQWRFFI